MTSPGKQPHEDAFIAVMQRRLGGGRSGAASIGDDGVLLYERDGRVVVVDAMVEGVHFDLRWSTLADVAFKAIAVNASDIWAMGAEPTAWLLTAGIGAEHSRGALATDVAASLADGFGDAMSALDLSMALVGGDTVRAARGGTFLSVTMFGQLDGAPLLRSGASVGDSLWIDGPLGYAAAGLHALSTGQQDAAAEEFLGAHRRPVPRRLLARDAAARGISAALDVSDGLARDALRMARASQVHMELDAVAVVTPGLDSAAERLGGDALGWALHGGDDYVKLVAAPSAPGPGWTRVGGVQSADPGLTLLGPDGSRRPLIPAGFEHFDE